MVAKIKIDSGVTESLIVVLIPFLIVLFMFFFNLVQSLIFMIILALIGLYLSNNRISLDYTLIAFIMGFFADLFLNFSSRNGVFKGIRGLQLKNYFNKVGTLTAAIFAGMLTVWLVIPTISIWSVLNRELDGIDELYIFPIGFLFGFLIGTFSQPTKALKPLLPFYSSTYGYIENRLWDGLSVVIALVPCYFLVNPWMLKIKFDGKTRKNYTEINKGNLDELHRMLVATDYAMKKSNTEYWACCGTLLGAVRHGGFMPWDYDIDIQMDKDEYNKNRKSIKKYLNEVGYSLSEYTPDEGLMARVTRKGKSFFTTKLHMDIFTINKKTNLPFNTKRKPGTFKCLESYPNKGLTELKFGRIKIPVVSNYEDACEKAWGENWKYIAVGKMTENKDMRIDLRKTPVDPILPSKNFMARENKKLIEHYEKNMKIK